MPATAEPLLILGASVRAAAFSASRAGMAPNACDLFADADLSRHCPATRVESYPAGLAHWAFSAPPAAWMYTGGLENHPQLVDEIASQRTLYGVGGETLRAVRDPWRLRAALTARGLLAPACLDAQSPPPCNGDWLRKRLRSSGGAGVAPWDEALARRPHAASVSDVYFQQRIAGLPCAGVFVAAARQAHLLGVTEQIIGAAWCGAGGFQYAGSLGPLRLRPEILDQWRRIGDCLAETFSLVGLFGVDAVQDDRAVWPVEVNPRYTASVETLERGLDLRTVDLHVRGCREGRVAPPPRGGASMWTGKAIVYASKSIQISPATTRRLLDANQDDWPVVADIPAAGTHIRARRPILTVFARAKDRDGLLNALQASVSHWRRVVEDTA